MSDKKVAIGVGLATIIGGIVLATKAKAAPPEGYVCPYCGQPFPTDEELASHIQTEHPEQIIPEFIYVSAIRQIHYEDYPGQPWSHYCVRAEIDVKNVSQVAGMCMAQARARALADGQWLPWVDFTTRKEGCLKETIIQPSETVTFWDTMLRSSAYGYTVQIRFIGDPDTTAAVKMT